MNENYLYNVILYRKQFKLETSADPTEFPSAFPSGDLLTAINTAQDKHCLFHLC